MALRNLLRPPGIPEGMGVLQQSFQDKVDHPDEKYDNGDLVNPVHHFDVDIGWSCRVFLAEEISAHFPQGEELLPTFFFFRVSSLMCVHNGVCLSYRRRFNPVPIGADNVYQFINSFR